VRGHSFTPGTIPDCTHCHSQTELGRSHISHSAYPCSTCHGEVVNVDAIILIPDRHGDGKVDVRLTVGSWDPVVRTCAGTGSGCHGKRSIGW
jgi:DnaJ-class molecular chaperone